MGRVLATITTILILVLGAAFVVPALVDWESLRAPLEDAASAALGRKIETKGKIEITLLPEPHVQLGEVTVTGNGRELQAALVKADAVDIVLSLQALLAGNIEANNVKLLRPSLRLDLSGSKQNGSEDAEANPLLFAAEIHNLEIEDGRLTVFAKELASGKPISFDKINGTLSSQAPGASYHFGGQFARDGKAFDIRFLASAAPGGNIRLGGSIADPVSKASLQADGSLSIGDGPVFKGSLAATSIATNTTSNRKIGVQAKSAARVNLSGISLGELSVTIDPENRPQTLTGSGIIGFASGTTSFNLQARSIDADLLLTGRNAGLDLQSSGTNWGASLAAVNQLLWLYPSATLRLSIAADQMQLGGEPIENVKLDAQRSGNRWTFEKLLGLLPGDTALRVVGSVVQSPDTPKVSGVVSADGKNIGRLARWLAPTVQDAKGFPPSPFTINGSVTLSDEVAAFEGVSGKISGTPFRASLHLDKTPNRKLYLSLSGDSFDLSGFDIAQGQANVGSLGGLASWQAYFSRTFPLLSGYTEGLTAADVDISVRDVKTRAFEAQNLNARATFSPEMLTVSKLSIETLDGLSVSGEGSLPFKDAQQAKFEGHLQAKSARALSQAIKFSGYENLGERRLEDLAPASVNFSSLAAADAEGIIAKANGSLGESQFEGRAELKGMLSDWERVPVSLQFDATSPNGNHLISQLFSHALSAPPLTQAPGKLSIRLGGKLESLDTSFMIKAPLLQLQLEGATKYKEGAFEFAGKGSATSLTPDLFLPAPVLALLGGGAPGDSRLEASLVVRPDQIQAEKLRAELGQNVTTGSLSLDTSKNMVQLDANLKTSQLSLPAALNYFLVPVPGKGPSVQSLGNTVSAESSNAWPDRPFDLSAFRNVSAHIAIDAKTVKVSDTLAVSDSQIAVRLKDGRFEIQKFAGKAFGGEFDASLALEAGGNVVDAFSKISLTDIDLAAFPKEGKSALLGGKAAVSLSVSGQGLSPRGLISVIKGRGRIGLSDGEILKLSPGALNKAADQMLANMQPLSEEEITQRVLKAVQSGDFRFRRTTIPVVIRDGVLETQRASFRNRDGTVWLDAYLDLSKMQFDSTWQIGVSSDHSTKWPSVRLTLAGPLRELGSHPQSLSAEDFARAIIVKKMEGDINRLEGLNKPQRSPWMTTQESVRKSNSGNKGKAKPSPLVQGAIDIQAAQQTESAPNSLPTALPPSDFEKRMRDVLHDAANADSTARRAP